MARPPAVAGTSTVEITQIRIFPVDEEKLKAFVSVIFDNCFVVSDIKIIQGNNGLFISMPSKRRKNGTFRDIAHPLNHETRRRFEEEIIEKYRRIIAQVGEEAPHLREMGARMEPQGSESRYPDGAPQDDEDQGYS
jgi:stage V sporulation protein G